MSISEKYPENVPWDLNIDQNNNNSIKWILSKADIVYTFTRSRINNKYVYVQKNDGRRKQKIKGALRKNKVKVN